MPRRLLSWSISSFFSSTPSIQRDTVMPGLVIMRGAYCFLIHSKVDTPGLGEVLPRAFDHAVVAGQRIGVGADVGGALHVVVAAEDVGAAAALADVAQRQLQDARGAHHGVADGVLGLAHAPDDGAGAVLVQQVATFSTCASLTPQASSTLSGVHLARTSSLDLVHAVDAVIDVLLVFPAVLEDVVQQAEQEGDVGARADAHVLVGLGRGAGEARVHHDHLAAGFLGMQHVQHADRVRLGGVGADVQRALLFCMSLYELVIAP
jgi:hypothetical protein